MAEPDITLYAADASRAFTARWMLEEVGVAYRTRNLSLRKGQQKDAAYLAINPMGKVPAITDGDVVVTEGPAICLYLADRYAYGTLAPLVDAPERGPYLRWSVFATAVFEPAIYGRDTDAADGANGRGWGDYETVRGVVEDAVAAGPWLLGERFSAADVALGSLLSVALFNKRLPETPAIGAYNARLCERPAYKAAALANWPPHLFPVN